MDTQTRRTRWPDFEPLRTARAWPASVMRAARVCVRCTGWWPTVNPVSPTSRVEQGDLGTLMGVWIFRVAGAMVLRAAVGASAHEATAHEYVASRAGVEALVETHLVPTELCWLLACERGLSTNSAS
jgi:hypothetical protein